MLMECLSCLHCRLQGLATDGTSLDIDYLKYGAQVACLSLLRNNTYLLPLSAYSLHTVCVWSMCVPTRPVATVVCPVGHLHVGSYTCLGL